MHLLKRAFGISAAISAAIVLFAGCKTTPNRPVEPNAPAAPAAAPQAAQTNQVQLPSDSGDNMKPNILAWDATEKTYRARPGDKSAPFTFSLTNLSSTPVVIYDTSSTCDCTVAKMPAKPWVVPSGGSGQIEVTMDLRHKVGPVTKDVIIFTSQGNRRLNVTAIVPNS